MTHNPLLTVTRRRTPYTPVPGVTDFGRWHLTERQSNGQARHGACLVPEAAPWRGLFAALDAAASGEPVEPVSLEAHVTAIIACCWRYGSYLDVLTTGESYPPFRADATLSRINDDEMRRINLEFSAGLADWLAVLACDPERIYRRVRAAHLLLAIPWFGGRAPWWEDSLRSAVQRLVDEVSAEKGQIADPLAGVVSTPEVLRRDANALVHRAYRKGPIENLHGGRWIPALDIPGFKRLYAHEVRQVARAMSEKLAELLVMRESGIWPAFRAYPGAADWSVTEETAAVAFDGVPGGPRLDARLRWLAERYPTIYGTVERDSN